MSRVPEAAGREGNPREGGRGDVEVLRWETLTKERFDAIDRSRAVVFVTCSPLEVHGPHLPLGADALEGAGLARRTLRFLPERHRDRPFLELPFLYVASDTVPQAGSVTFHPLTTSRVIEELGRSLAGQGFRDVVVSNFHGGPRHFVAIEKGCHRVHRRTGIRMVSLFSLMLGRLTDGSAELDGVLGSLPGVRREDLVGDTHGGLVETSQLLALHPEWVSPRYRELPRSTVSTWRAQRSGGESPAPRGPVGRLRALLARSSEGVRYFRERSYAGAPAGASPELGERILDALASRTAEALIELLDGRLDPADCHSPLWRYRWLLLHPLAIRLANRWLGLDDAPA